MGVKIKFELTIELEDDELSNEQSELFDTMLSNMEELIGKASLTLDDSSWEEVQ